MPRYYFPLDPNCPGARKLINNLKSGLEDPMTTHYGAGEFVQEMYEDNANRHRVKCSRCQQYGAANVEVE